MNTLLIDANLLCVIVAGNVSPNTLGRHKRLRAYGEDDFRIITAVAVGFSKIVTCPQVLAETSNLLALTHDSERAQLLAGLKAIMTTIEEVHVPFGQASDHAVYPRLGLTDAVLMTLEIASASLFTADLNLAIAAQSAGKNVLNYNWMRPN